MGCGEDEGCWVEHGPFRSDGRGALFLDRDGVVVEEVGYLHRSEDVRLIPAAAQTIAAFNAAEIAVIMVTNQSGLARGYFGWADFQAVQAEIAAELVRAGAHFDAVFACGYHQDGYGSLKVADHPWRKPNPGMFLAAGNRLGVDLSRSMVVGDRAQDLLAGRAAGLRQGVHVATGHGAAEEQAAAIALERPDFSVSLQRDIGGALEMISQLQVLPC